MLHGWAGYLPISSAGLPRHTPGMYAALCRPLVSGMATCVALWCAAWLGLCSGGAHAAKHFIACASKTAQASQLRAPFLPSHHHGFVNSYITLVFPT